MKDRIKELVDEIFEVECKDHRKYMESVLTTLAKEVYEDAAKIGYEYQCYCGDRRCGCIDCVVEYIRDKAKELE